MSRDTQEMERKHMRPIPDNDEDQDSESDTISIGGVSEAGEDAGEATAPESPIRLRPRGRQEAFASLDVVELKSVFSRQAPFILKGAFRSALRTALDEVIAGHDQGNESRMTRGWKLFMLLPRLLLHRPARGGMVPREKPEERVSCFQEGMWLRLLVESQSSSPPIFFRRRRNQVDSLEKQGMVSGPDWRVVRSSGCSRGSRSRTRDVGDFEGVDKPRTPTSPATSRVEARGGAQ